MENLKLSLSRSTVVSPEERRDLILSAVKISLIQFTARKAGFAAIGKECAHYFDDPFYRKGLSLLVDGFDPDIIENILLNYLIHSAKSPKEILEGLLIIDGLLAVQAGNHYLVVYEVCISHLGLDIEIPAPESIDKIFQDEEAVTAIINNTYTF